MVWIWGENKKAELGLGDTATRAVPFPLCQLKDKPVSRICVGQSYTIAIVGSIKGNSTQFGSLDDKNLLAKTGKYSQCGFKESLLSQTGNNKEQSDCNQDLAAETLNIFKAKK